MAAPDAVRVALLPLQMVDVGVTLIVVAGDAFTVIACVAVLAHPFEPVTV